MAYSLKFMHRFLVSSAVCFPCITMDSLAEQKAVDPDRLIRLLHVSSHTYSQIYNSLFCVFCSAMDSKIEGLHTTGSTALGPALAISAGMIAEAPMSEVILCTDGEPNVGIGTLSGSRRNAGSEFYKTVIFLHSGIHVVFASKCLSQYTILILTLFSLFTTIDVCFLFCLCSLITFITKNMDPD